MRALGLCIAVDFLIVKSLNTWTATAGRPLFLSRSSYCHRGWGHFLEPILGSHSDIRGNFGIKKCTKHPLFSQNTQCKSPTQNFVFEIKNISGRSAVAIFHLKIFVVPDVVLCFFFATNLTKIQTTAKFAQVPNIKRFAVIFCQYLKYLFFLRSKLLWHILYWLVLCSHSFSLCLTCLNCLIHCHCVPIVWVSSLKDSQIYGELGCRLQ